MNFVNWLPKPLCYKSKNWTKGFFHLSQRKYISKTNVYHNSNIIKINDQEICWNNRNKLFKYYKVRGLYALLFRSCGWLGGFTHWNNLLSIPLYFSIFVPNSHLPCIRFTNLTFTTAYIYHWKKLKSRCNFFLFFYCTACQHPTQKASNHSHHLIGIHKTLIIFE